MTNDERADRRNRIRNADLGSKSRVQDFVELVARMCVDRTRAKTQRGKTIQRGISLGYTKEYETER